MIPPTAPLGEALRLAREALESSPSPRLDAEVLLAHVLGAGRTYVVSRPEAVLAATEGRRYAALISARVRGTPVAHLTGWREFWSLCLRVTPRTLIPRPETELLVELAIAALPRGGRLLDLGTGSGAIAFAVASERHDVRIDAVDRDADALAVAAVNRRLHAAPGVRLLCGEWLAPVRGTGYDVIAANPPYVDSADQALLEGDVRFEPRHALAAGNGGLAAIAAIMAEAPLALRPGGMLALEHGWNQGEAVRAALAGAGLRRIATRSDLHGHERVSLGHQPP